MHIRKTKRTALVTGLAVIAGLSLATGAPAMATGGTERTGGHSPERPTSAPHDPSSNKKVKQETGIYLYKKVDPSKPAAWENSGPQTFLDKQRGHRWFTDIAHLIDQADVDEEICGPGWAVQQDQLEFKGSYTWPETIVYPNQFPGDVKLVRALHQELGALVAVPECDPEPTAPPTTPPTAPPTTPPEPTAPPTVPPTTPAEPTTPPTAPPTVPPTAPPTTPPTTPPADKPSVPPPGTPTPSTPPASTTATPSATATPSTAVTPAGGTASTPAAADPALASTGVNGMFLAAGGAAVLVLGAVLVMVTRRRGRHS